MAAAAAPALAARLQLLGLCCAYRHSPSPLSAPPAAWRPPRGRGWWCRICRLLPRPGDQAARWGEHGAARLNRALHAATSWLNAATPSWCPAATPPLPLANQQSCRGSVLTLINSAVGAGVLSFPFALSCTGWAAGLAAIAGIAAVEAFTLYVLSCFAEQTGATTYSSLVGGRVLSEG